MSAHHRHIAFTITDNANKPRGELMLSAAEAAQFNQRYGATFHASERDFAPHAWKSCDEDGALRFSRVSLPATSNRTACI